MTRNDCLSSLLGDGDKFGDLADLLESLTANAKVTALGSFPECSDTMESQGQC